MAGMAHSVTFVYGPQEAVGHLAHPDTTAVLVLRDSHHPWHEPSFAAWHRVVFMDMPCNARERWLVRIGAMIGWDAHRLEQWADHKLLQMWRGNAFPFRPFLREHAESIDQWIRECLKNPRITTISIHCVYGKNRSRAVWAVWTGRELQGNEDVYRELLKTKHANDSS